MESKEKTSNPKKTELKEENELLKKKRKEKGSYEKEVCIYDKHGDNEYIKEKKSFKKVEDFEKFISSLKNPYTLFNDQVFDLNTSKSCQFFFHNEYAKTIYQRDNNEKIYEYYKQYYYQYENEEEEIYREYPVPLDKILLAPEFYFDQIYLNKVKLYRLDDSHFFNLFMFFNSLQYNLFHLYMRKWSGSSLYFMKQMERKHEGYIYIDLRKLTNIIEENYKNPNELNEQIKKFIFYSLFNIEPIFSVSEKSFKIIEKYYYYILSETIMKLLNNGIKVIAKSILDAYIKLYKTFILKRLESEEKEKYKMLIIILDHYNYEIDYDYINDILKNNDEYLKFIIKHSLTKENEIYEFFQNIKDSSFNQNCEYKGCVKGIEIIKNKTVIAYYEHLYPFDSRNFNDNDLPALKLYKEELLEKFGLINPIYLYKFLDYIKDKDQENKKESTFLKFLKIISTEIELEIRNFYNNSLEDEYFFLSKYYSINLEKKELIDKKKLNHLVKNIPLDFFIINFSSESKDILNIIPSCNLVKEILLKKSKNLNSIIYQSKYYNETENEDVKDNILLRAIEEKLSNDPSTLLNYAEKTVIFKLEYLIPSVKNIQSEKFDPVLEYYNSINGKNKIGNKDIISYMSDIEKNDMKNFLDKIIKDGKSLYQNIILIQKDVYGNNYDLGIIKFLGDNSFVIILYHIIVSKKESKFSEVNQSLERDICYITAKFENYLEGYKSKGVYLIYVLDKDENIDLKNKMCMRIDDETKRRLGGDSKKSLKNNPEHNEDIDFKNGLNQLLKNNVYLLFFGRKYLKFLTEDGKIIKEMVIKNEKIEFITSDKNQYFLEENIQKVFDKIVGLFDIEIGKFFIDNYDFGDMIGNYMIITKINKNLVTVIIIIDGKKLHCLEANEKNIIQVSNITYNEKVSYIFEIINPKKITKISLFLQVNIDN